MNYFTPAEFLARYAASGKAKTEKAAGKLFCLAVLAGMLIAFAGAATNTVLSTMENPGLARLVCGLLFPFGLCMVIVSGAELFTGNSLLVLSLLNGSCTLTGLLRNWGIVYLGNFLGSVLAAAGCVYFGQLELCGGKVLLQTVRLAAGKCALTFSGGFGLGLFCNLLVCLGVLMALSAKDAAGRLLGAFIPVCYFVTCGFEHSVANMYYISAGLLSLRVPRYAELLGSVDVSGLTLGNFLLKNLLPVTLGNIAGGIALAVLLWYAHCSGKE